MQRYLFRGGSRESHPVALPGLAEFLAAFSHNCHRVPQPVSWAIRHKRMRAPASFLTAQANACGGIHRNQAASELASKAANHHKRPRAPASFLAAKRGLWMALTRTKSRANPRARRPAPQAYPDGRRFRLRQNARRHKQAGPFRRARFQQTASATGVPDAPAAVQPGRICPDGSAHHPRFGDDAHCVTGRMRSGKRPFAATSHVRETAGHGRADRPRTWRLRQQAFQGKVTFTSTTNVQFRSGAKRSGKIRGPLKIRPLGAANYRQCVSATGIGSLKNKKRSLPKQTPLSCRQDYSLIISTLSMPAMSLPSSASFSLF